MQEFVTHSYEETLQMAADFAKTVKKGTVIGFSADSVWAKPPLPQALLRGLA